jgi:hypothetical protein
MENTDASLSWQDNLGKLGKVERVGVWKNHWQDNLGKHGKVERVGVWKNQMTEDFVQARGEISCSGRSASAEQTDDLPSYAYRGLLY